MSYAEIIAKSCGEEEEEGGDEEGGGEEGGESAPSIHVCIYLSIVYRWEFAFFYA